VSRLRLGFVAPRRLSRSHRVGVIVAVLVALVGVLGLVSGWGSSTSTHAVDEAPGRFLAGLVHAQRVGDETFLYARLDAAVRARYGNAQCYAAMGLFTDPSIALRLVSVSGPDRYSYVSDGHSVSVPNTFTFRVSGTEVNETVSRDLHFALVEHRFRIFVDCGQPLPGAP
jgi:hypothetical protein